VPVARSVFRQRANLRAALTSHIIPLTSPYASLRRLHD
jgi:hypothetical protein